MKSTTKISKLNIIDIIVAMSLFFTTEVYLKWHSSLFCAFAYIILLVVVYYVIKGKVNRTGDMVIFVFCFSLMFLWAQSKNEVSIVAYILLLFMPFTLLIPWKKRELYLDLFVTKIFPVFIGVSVACYILFLAGYEFLPQFDVDALNKAKPYNYISYIFFVIPDNPFYAMRFCSFYDEPGVVGTLMGVIIFFFHKKLNVFSMAVYLVAGILSLSLFFFISLFFWLFFASEWSVRNKLLTLVVLFIIGAVVIGFLDGVFQTEELFARFSFKEGGVSGNTRNQGTFSDFFYNKFIYSDDFWTGYKGNSDIAAGSSSFEKLIFLNGFFYFSFGLILYLLFFLKYRVSLYQFVVNFAFWFGLNYQRPSYDVLFFYLIFTTVLQSQYYKRKEMKVVDIKKKTNGNHTEVLYKSHSNSIITK